MPAETPVRLHSSADFEILLNGEKRRFRAGSTLAGVVALLGLPEDRVAVEFERAIVKRELWASTEIFAGCDVEIVQFVGGG